MTSTLSFSCRIAIGVDIVLLVEITSSGCCGTSTVKVKSPSVLGVQRTASVVLDMAVMRTSFVTRSPSEPVNTTLATWSRGREDSMEKGMRTALLVIPKVGVSTLSSSMSGKRVAAPTGIEIMGTPCARYRIAAFMGD